MLQEMDTVDAFYEKTFKKKIIAIEHLQFKFQ